MILTAITHLLPTNLTDKITHIYLLRATGYCSRDYELVIFSVE